MKFIHCADLHLDSKMTANLTTEQARERRNEILLTFRRMVRYALENQVTGIIIAGDLYDKKNISATARNTIVSIIRENPSLQFYYLRGNHDAETLLNGFEKQPDNLYLFSEENWTSYHLKGEGITITGAELNEENKAGLINSLLLDERDVNIVVLHGQMEERSMKGAERRTAFGTAGLSRLQKTETSKGTSVSIGLKALQNRGIDYLALGHVHAVSRGSLDGRGSWCYPGCLEGRGFDECGEHGFVLLDISEESHEIQMSFVPMAERRLYEICVPATGCRNSHEILLTIEKQLQEEACTEKDLVRILLTGEVELETEINTEYLEKQLENNFYYLKIINETKIKVDYASFIGDVSLKGEFVRLVQQDEDLKEADRAEIIRYGIRLLMGEMDDED